MREWAELRYPKIDAITGQTKIKLTTPAQNEQINAKLLNSAHQKMCLFDVFISGASNGLARKGNLWTLQQPRKNIMRQDDVKYPLYLITERIA